MKAHNNGQPKSLRQQAKDAGIPWSTFRRNNKTAEQNTTVEKPRVRVQALSIAIPEIIQKPSKSERPLLGGSLEGPEARVKKANGRRWVITSAQNNTRIFDSFFKAILGFCDHNGAELLVAGFSYNKNAFENPHQQTKASEDLWYDEAIQPFLVNAPTRLAKDLVFCGELDILPTAVDPMSGLDSYTKSSSGIIPHAKIAMKSMAVMKGQHARFLYTTGACTQLNYIQRKAGQKAEFHHVFGAIYVEVDESGDWFCRQLIAGSDGSFYDLDKHYSACGISRARVEAITWGDFHEEKRDTQVLNACFDSEHSILESLRPREQHVHDLADFTARNHHNRGSAYFLAQTHFSGGASVRDGMKSCADKLQSIERSWCRTVVVESNHDQAFRRWLEEADGHRDPINASYWHRWNLRMFEAIEAGVEPLIFEEAVRSSTKSKLQNTTFLREDDSWVICADQGDGIECGMHGHRGPNGSRGSPKSYRQIGRRCNTAHTHSCGIVDGIYTAGVSGSLDMGYNKGPSSWSHSHIITYPNGKRAILTMRGKKWRAT
ncbi:hypothetical protein ACELLULO517_15860 [Acidisoma cellulosilytica]|uniref:A1 protein n=1 Tax=Acidisoma cellulosilyticum TaxID=2802395 RepID=A0A963Z3C2_9PROT|nr:hypothetical protein [Acidisoma cellulosilyticum]MCB8881724.1 hypothetical protein [Acidisoma cellulosilyticum]